MGVIQNCCLSEHSKIPLNLPARALFASLRPPHLSTHGGLDRPVRHRLRLRRMPGGLGRKAGLAVAGGSPFPKEGLFKNSPFPKGG